MGGRGGRESKNHNIITREYQKFTSSWLSSKTKKNKGKQRFKTKEKQQINNNNNNNNNDNNNNLSNLG